MADLYAITEESLPRALHGTDGIITIRQLSDWEQVAIEDRLFGMGTKVSLKDRSTVVIVPHGQAGVDLPEFAGLIEFALGIATVSGFQSITMTASFNNAKCVDALPRLFHATSLPPKYPQKLDGKMACVWIRHLFEAQRKTKGSIHVTADRFVRFLRTEVTRDALVDLCICLESLIDAEAEIAFRFSVCLAKVCGFENPAEVGALLKDLYDLRSKVVHGSDPTKAHKKIEPNIAKLRLTARTILTSYVLYLSQHSKDDWQAHLRKSLFV
jgi:hypothetical protein